MAGARNAAAAATASRAASRQQPPASSSTPAPGTSASMHGQILPSSAPASSSKEGVRARQKRVLPARSRRGGPGVGTCESDVMILETMKRKAESEPLIPATTKFLLTTNKALLPPVEASVEAQLNTPAYGRYFDRPEVQAAYKAQQLIQTPDFTELPRDANVGGRFRPRGSEDEAADTSDAAYEKRHRKYETFEKRQRLREKEKLKHEHYKLKERIDQLRAMDSSAFLALPASDFSEARGGTPGPSGGQNHDHTDDYDEKPLDSSHLHGAAAYHEGERRRKEMLETALQLERRYRTLLPPDRRWMEKKLEKPQGQVTSVETVADEDDEVDDDESEPGEDGVAAEEGAEEDENGESEPEGDDGESEIDLEEQERERSKKLKLRIKFPPRMLAGPGKQESKPPPSRGGGKQITLSPFFKQHAEATSKRGRYSVDTADTLHQAPSAKRARVYESISTAPKAKAKAKATKAANGAVKAESVSSSGLAGKREPTECVLMVAAVRQVTAPTARKTQRHVTAFGVRVPPELEEVRDFEIPHWVLPHSGASDDGDRRAPYAHSHAYMRSEDGYSVSVGDVADDGT
ncbi:hypothetical protein BD413DRAFT_609503 [Trametes elegans]|nr:hypothetical protein BD413DRAFT_609503 [Trametes elegans]